MSNTQTMKTAGLNPDGTSRLSVTKKKKSKSRWIIPAIIGGAALFSGIGGMSAASGSSGFFSSFKNILSGTGKFLGLGSGASASEAIKIGPSGNMTIIPGSGMSAAGLKSVPSLSTASDSGWFSKIFSSIGNMSGSQMIGLGSILSAGGSTLSALFDDSDEMAAELLAEEQRQFDERMEYNYAALESQAAMHESTINLKNRQNALAGTFMGYTNPVVDVEGISSTKGYTPSKAASIPEIHPTGLLSQAEQTS